MEKAKIKIAWIHNFSIDINPYSGVFMYQLFDAMKTNQKIDIELINIGNLSNPFRFLFNYLKYKKKLKSYDLLHTQYGSGVGFFVSLFKNKKIISLRGSDWYESPSVYFKEKLHIMMGNFLTSASIRRYDKIIVMSERMKNEVKSKFPESSPIVIPDGIDLKKFYPENIDENNKFRVLFSTASKDNPIKRYKLAQDAFEIFQKKYPQSEMVFMTGIPHQQVNSFINSCHVVLLTSTHEGWPNIIKEGLACNIPFVSTDVSDLKNLSEETDCCFVCNASENELANALEKVYLLQKNKKNLTGLVQNFEMGRITENLVKLYCELF